MTAKTGAPIQRGRLRVVARVLGAVLAGYAFSAALVALLSVVVPQLSGMARSEAVLLASMLGFLIYLAILIWSFAEPRVTRVWAVLAGGAVLAYALLHLVKASVLNA